jgi:hypothetical protein
MASIFQTLRSAVTRRRPAAGTRKAGELFINMADRQIGYIDDQQKAVDLLPVTTFSAAATYAINDIVANDGLLYQAKVAVAAPGPWDPAAWKKITPTPTDYVHRNGDTMGGALGIKAAAPGIYLDKDAAGVPTVISGATAGKARWQMQFGDGTPEAGQNKGSDFSITRCDDAGAGIDSPFKLSRETGIVTIGPVLLMGNDKRGGNIGNSAIITEPSQDTLGLWGGVSAGDGGHIGLRGPTYPNSANSVEIFAGTAAARKQFWFKPDGVFVAPGDIAAGHYFMSADSGGKIGMTTGNRVDFHWNNGFYYGIDNNTWVLINTSASDARMKEAVQEVGDALALVMQLRPLRYRFKADLPISAPPGERIGFMLQDARTVLPGLGREMGKPDDSGETFLAYHEDDAYQLIAVLTRAMQQQQEAIVALQAEVEALKAARPA